jgi:DNA-binding phage protein
MSPTSFQQKMAADRQTWSADTHVVHEAVTSAVKAGVQERIALGAQLADARHTKRMTQLQVAKASGVNQAEVSRIERGTSNSTIDTLERVGGSVGLRLGFEPA